ncbi:MAG TPA: hypothetical protein VFV50_11895 [Bdellovibrionales bacterium]|nr:hypothetical protein [Bdellovibrionales bacterium]
MTQILGFIVFMAGVLTPALAETPPALAEARKISGRYLGRWTVYGLERGELVVKTKWSDTLTAGDARLEGGRAVVDVTTQMTFIDGSQRTLQFREGYFLLPDGSAGERFIENQGQVTLVKRLSPNDWALQTVPQPEELRFLGFDPSIVLSASHVTTKTTTYKGAVDTDHVARFTTVQWKNTATGAIETTQFLSMIGVHKRIQ